MAHGKSLIRKLPLNIETWFRSTGGQTLRYADRQAFRRAKVLARRAKRRNRS